MTIATMLFQTLEDLRNYIVQTLCDQDQLEIGAFPVSERMLTQQSQPCGMYFCLHGPRSVKFSAIWDAVRNVILFYGASGERFQVTKLAAAPTLSKA